MRKDKQVLFHQFQCFAQIKFNIELKIGILFENVALFVEFFAFN
jgi:hypothetical protein